MSPILIKWTLLLTLGWAVQATLRRRHARWRLILWRSLLCLGLVLPLAQIVKIPRFQIPLAGAAGSAAAAIVSRVPRLAADSGRPAEWIAAPASQSSVISPTVFRAQPIRPTNPPQPISWGSVLLAVWALGFLWGALRLFRLQLQLVRLRNEARSPSPDLFGLAEAIRARFGVHREVGVRISDAVTSPFVCGLFKPTIILPRAIAREFSAGELSALLNHEMAHLRQHDLVWCLAWRWMKTLCWFHPLVWQIPAAHNLACEQEADRRASQQLADQDSYARLLARLALRVLALPAVETKLALNGSSQIARRLTHLRQKGMTAWNWRHSAVGFGLAGLLLLAATGFEFAKAQAAEPKTALTLDLAAFRDPEGNGLFTQLQGPQSFDGLPFQVDRQVTLWGQTAGRAFGGDSEKSDAQAPAVIQGIRIGRKFAELHLLDYAKFEDVEGTCIARIRLNYDGGETEEFPILYGGQVRSDHRLPSEEKEVLTDAGSKVIWRGATRFGSATSRMFTSTLENPHPDREVESMDVISTRQLAAYVLVAATVSDRGPADKRPHSFRIRMMPPTPPEPDFDGLMIVRVVDAGSGKPIAGVQAGPLMTMTGIKNFFRGPPFYTTADGQGVIRYPVKRTEGIALTLRKEGYASKETGWAEGAFPAEMVIQLDADPGRAGTAPASQPAGDALMLDLDRFVHPFFAFGEKISYFDSIRGSQVLDGVPFKIDGAAVLYGKYSVTLRDVAFPESAEGISVGRKFDELHLIHDAEFPETTAEGTPIALIRLNYRDGSKAELPIVYGTHVLDWMRTPFEQHERLADADSRVIFRHDQSLFSTASWRLFSSVLRNPSPRKEVTTIDVLSTHANASYALVAATVTSADSSRPLTPPVAEAQPQWAFDGNLTVRVLSAETGQPIGDAAVVPRPGSYCGNTVRTTAGGVGTVAYPVNNTTELAVVVEKAGYSKVDVSLNSPVPAEITVSLLPQ